MNNIEKLNGIHSGETCFVIGAGSSIYFQNLKPLKDFVTIAVNSGQLAIKDPTYFVSDDWSVANWSYFYQDLINSNTKLLLYEDKLSTYAPLFGGRAYLFKHRQGYNITDKYSHSNKNYHICQSRTSFGSAIHIAHIMGCSKICLLGLDCFRTQDKRYFWQFWDRNKQPRRKDGISNDSFIKTINNGKSTDTDLEDMLVYWKNKGEVINKKCNVYNASPKSAVEVFTKVNLEDFIKEMK